jgi:Trypsin-like peptidase domain
MKLNLLLAVVFLVPEWRSFSASLPAPYSGFAVQISRGEPKEALGSGFILQASNSVYIVTARHVLFHAEGTNGWQFNNPAVEVDAYPSPSGTNEEHVVFDLDLQILRNLGEVRFSTNRDVALIRFESCNRTNKAIVTLLPGIILKSSNWRLNPLGSDLVKTGVDTSSVGSDVFLFGFPSFIGVANIPQVDPSRPLLRKGIIAGFNPSRKTIILDCPVYQGNSGGPVLTREQVSLWELQFRVVGIAVEWIPFQDVMESKRFGFVNQTLSNSGYSVVEPSERFMEMVWE